MARSGPGLSATTGNPRCGIIPPPERTTWFAWTSGKRRCAHPEGPNEPRDISWDEFFVLFDRLGLSFAYEEAEDVTDMSQLYRFGRRLRVE